MDKIPVILDTDIGSDIDDAVALSYLLRQPRCELAGITTVSGEPDRRASLADAICRAAGRDDVPIHVGTDLPLLNPPRQTQAPQAEALADRWPHRSFARENTAIAFLRETIHSRPGEITLLTIGPLTNIALLFAVDPEIPTLLKQLVMMGGRFFFNSPSKAVAEWNIVCDPHAAARVFSAPVPSLTAVGLDVTTRCVLDAATCRKRFAAAAGPLAPVADMAEVWFRRAGAITFHDPLAAALVFDETLCTTEPHGVEVDLMSVRAQGQTLTIPEERPNACRLAATVDADAFFTHYFAVVGG
jgi:purine nucleosidase